MAMPMATVLPSRRRCNVFYLDQEEVGRWDDSDDVMMVGRLFDDD